MIRDVMVWLDVDVSDEIRLAAVADIARRPGGWANWIARSRSGGLISWLPILPLAILGIDPSIISGITRSTRPFTASRAARVRSEQADLIVMGGYGHMRLRERLLGGVTYNLMHESPVPLLMAH